MCQQNGVTPQVAAELCGSNAVYIGAWLTILQAEDPVLQAAVLAGRVPLLKAAAQSRPAAILIDAYRKAAPADKLAFATAITPAVIWDETIAPVIGSKPASTTPTVEAAFEALHHAA
jgi:hypothetical protein